MGRHRFEDQFKEKLAQREITPSTGSWDKLSGQLNSEEKNQTATFWWIGIAATLLGAILIAGIVYNNDPVTNTPVLVETPVEIEIEDKNEPSVEQKIATENNIITNSPTKEDSAIPQKGNASQPIRQSQETILIAEVKKENSPVINEHEFALAPDKEKISQKLEEIIAQVSMKDLSAEDSTYDEIDALLFKAVSEISLERRNFSSTGTVDAGDLLFAVEMELEESFREKVFDLLKEGFLKARTAVANRNYP